jgi:hypothetical protein
VKLVREGSTKLIGVRALANLAQLAHRAVAHLQPRESTQTIVPLCLGILRVVLVTLAERIRTKTEKGKVVAGLVEMDLIAAVQG